MLLNISACGPSSQSLNDAWNLWRIRQDYHYQTLPYVVVNGRLICGTFSIAQHSVYTNQVDYPCNLDPTFVEWHEVNHFLQLAMKQPFSEHLVDCMTQVILNRAEILGNPYGVCTQNELTLERTLMENYLL